MKPVIVSSSGVSTSNPVVFDLKRNPFSVGFGCVVTGTATYTIQHTFDAIQTLGAAACTWFNHDDSSLVNATANANGNFAFPATAARINQTVGSGSVVTTFIQSGDRGA